MKIKHPFLQLFPHPIGKSESERKKAGRCLFVLLVLDSESLDSSGNQQQISAPNEDFEDGFVRKLEEQTKMLVKSMLGSNLWLLSMASLALVDAPTDRVCR